MGLHALLQRNAILSWLELNPTPEILIMGGREKGVREFAEKHEIKVIDVDYTEHGRPLWRSIFLNAQKEAKYDILCQTNSDIIHFQCLIEAAKVLSSDLEDYVCTGQRYDLDIDFEINWKNEKTVELLHNFIKEKGVLHSYSGCDYFIFPRSHDWSMMPDLEFGRCGGDTWVNANSVERGVLVNATGNVTLIHQNHEHASDEEDERNKRFLKPGQFFGCDVANYFLSGGIQDLRKVIIT